MSNTNTKRLGHLRLSVLGPPNATERTRCAHSGWPEDILERIQRFRGRTYLADGAIPNDAVDETGRHMSILDEAGWHLFVHDESYALLGCIRLNVYGYDSQLEHFHVSHVIGRMAEAYRNPYASAAGDFVRSWGLRGLRIGEVGGWAVSEELRKSSAGITLAVSVFSLSSILNNVALAAATVRHNSNDILIRLGGFPLSYDGDELPPVYDPAYGCKMQILGFHWRTKPKYERMAADIRAYLCEQIYGSDSISSKEVEATV